MTTCLNDTTTYYLIYLTLKVCVNFTSHKVWGGKFTPTKLKCLVAPLKGAQLFVIEFLTCFLCDSISFFSVFITFQKIIWAYIFFSYKVWRNLGKKEKGPFLAINHKYEPNCFGFVLQIFMDSCFIFWFLVFVHLSIFDHFMAIFRIFYAKKC